jgi:hypothetical protein
MSTPFLLILPALLLCSLATWRSIVFRKKMEQQSKLLAEANATLAEMHKKLGLLQEKDQKSSDFNRTLNQAEISVRLQKSQLSAQNYNRSMSPPERYSYVHSLAAKGLSSQEIAAVLSISIHEADQLVNLSRLAHSK